MQEVSKPSDSSPAYRMGWFIFTLGALFYIYEYVLRIFPSLITHQLMSAHHISAGTLGNMIAFYYYIYSPMQIPVGVLMDRYRPRRLLVIATLSCTVGSFLFVTAHNLLLAEFGRFLTGFGSAFAFVGVLKLAVIWLPEENFGFVTGLATMSGVLAAIGSDWFFPPLLHAFDWKELTYWITFIGVLLSIALWIWIKDNNPKATTEAPKTIHFRELFSQFKLISKNPQIWLNGLIASLLYVPTTGFAELWSIPYLEATKHLNTSQAAHITSMLFIGWAIGAPIVGRISDYCQSRRVPVLIGATGATLTLTTTFIYLPNLSVQIISVAFLIIGIFSSCQILTFAINRELAPPQITGISLALNNMCVMLSGVVAQPLIGLLLERNWDGHMIHGMHIYSAQNFQKAIYILPGCLILTVVCCFFLKETFGRCND